MQHRKCIIIRKRSAFALVMIFIASGVRHSETAAGNEMNMTDSNSKMEQQQQQQQQKESNNDNTIIPLISPVPGKLTLNDTTSTANMLCAYGFNDKDIPCVNLTFPCIRCSYNYSCHYGRDLNVTCEVLSNVQCQGERSFQRTMNCRYCYQTAMWQQRCVQRAHCNSANEKPYRTNCTVHHDVLCLGNRSFSRNLRCNWTQGYRWSTAFIISLTLGGFGADRFYLGHWQEGIGKLFSFGGLGVWTIIDVLLISLHYLGPADGSLYI